MPGELSNKGTVLTGGGDRIGAECALAYGREGATEAILDCDLVSALCSNASAASAQSTTMQESPTLPNPFTKPLRPSGTTCSASPSNPSAADAAVFLPSHRLLSHQLLSHQARFLAGCILPVGGGAELGYRRQPGS